MSETATTEARPGRMAEGRDVGPVQSRDELIAAFRLLYENYLECGYCDEHPSGMHVSPYALLPNATTFVARHEGKLVATVSLVPDSVFGLPMDDVFGREMDTLRAAGRRLAEVGMLADRRAFDRRRLGDLLGLFKCVYDYARLILHVNELCITVNPHHVVFYERYLLFTQKGEPRPCDAVNGHPAVFLRLDLETVDHGKMRSRELRRILSESSTPVGLLRGRYQPGPADIAFFLDACDPNDDGSRRVAREWLGRVHAEPSVDVAGAGDAS